MAVTQEAITAVLERLQADGHMVTLLSRSGGGYVVCDETDGLDALTGAVQRPAAYYFCRGIEAGLAMKSGTKPPKATDRGSDQTAEKVEKVEELEADAAPA